MLMVSSNTTEYEIHQPTFPYRNTNLTTIHEQKCHYESFKIQGGSCNTLVESKTEAKHSDKACPHPGSRPDEYRPDCRPRNSPIPLWTWLQSHSFVATLPPHGPRGNHTMYDPNNRPTVCRPNCEPGNNPMTCSNCSTMISEAVLSTQGPGKRH